MIQLSDIKQNIFLKRDLISNKGIIGIVSNDKGLIICESFEHPTKCIPYGRYECVRDFTGKYRFWKILNVPGRTAIEFHIGNYITDTVGCILLAQDRAFMRNDKTNQIELSITPSAKVFKKIIDKKLFDDRFVLNVVS